MSEERKYAILFAATILAARKLSEVGERSSPAREACVSDAITKAELILRKIDQRWPTNPGPGGWRTGSWREFGCRIPRSCVCGFRVTFAATK
jgi:hypothetical protein